MSRLLLLGTLVVGCANSTPLPCTLAGTTCPAAITVVPTADSIDGSDLWGSNGDSYGPIRTDLSYVFAGFAPGTAPDGSYINPRAFEALTTDVLQIQDGVQLRILQTDGVSDCSVDYNLLVEAIAPTDDTILAGTVAASTVFLGNGAHTLSYSGSKHDGPIALFGPATDQPPICVDGGDCTVPGDAPIETVVPIDKPFRLRISVLDHGGSHGSTTSVALFITPPPP